MDKLALKLIYWNEQKIIFFLLLTLLAFSSCRKNPVSSSKQIEQEPLTKTAEIGQNPENQSTNQQDEEVKLPELEKPARERKDFKYIDAKLKLNYKSNKDDETVKVKLRMKKDSLIWASMTGPVGIEGVRVKILRDSVWIINRIEKSFMATNFDTLSRMLNFKVDFEMLQAIILGNMPITDYDSNSVSNEGNFIRIRQKAREIEIDNYLNPQSRKLEQLKLFDPKTQNILNLLYQSFVDHQGVLFPHSSKITVKYTNKDSQKIEDTKIDIDYSEVEFTDQALAFPFNIPEKYRRQY
jgi:hypothetical protein